MRISELRSIARSMLTAFFCAAIVGCAGPDAFERFTSELPPCGFPPLTAEQVHDAVLKAGLSSQIEGLPEPIWQVTEFHCVYRYEQSAFYFKGQPVPLNTIDGEDIVFVARDLTVFH